MARRWVCRQCGTGALAPQRMAADDTRRYCLGCSASTGRLVRRTCPALDRARDTQAQRRAVARRRERDRAAADAAARATVGGLDLRAELARLWALPSVRAAARSAERPTHPPALTVHRGRRSGVSGRAWLGSHRVHLTVGASDLHTVRQVLQHEVCHVALPEDAHHGVAFLRLLAASATEAFGVSCAPHDWQHGPKRGCRAYSLDVVIRRRMRSATRPVEACLQGLTCPVPDGLPEFALDEVALRAAVASAGADLPPGLTLTLPPRGDRDGCEVVV